MVDATAKFPVGIMKGNVFNSGNYDECLQVDVREDWGSFIGQHCVAIIKIPTSSLSLSNIPGNYEVINL